MLGIDSKDVITVFDPTDPVPFVLGALPFGSRLDRATSYAVLDRFREVGGRHLDTADNYVQWEPDGTGDESETLLGQWFRDRPGARDEMRLATKLGAREDADGVREGLSRSAIRSAIEGSLRRLGVDSVDLLYTHVMDPGTPVVDTVRALAELVAEGKTGALGGSNVDLATLSTAHEIADELHLPGYTVVQQRFSYLRPVPGADFGVQRVLDRATRDHIARRPGCVALGYSPLLFGTYLRPERMPEAYRSADSAARLAALDRVARGHGVSPVRVVLAWMLRRAQPVIPVLGVSSVAQLDDCLAAAGLQLDPAELDALDGAGELPA